MGRRTPLELIDRRIEARFERQEQALTGIHRVLTPPAECPRCRIRPASEWVSQSLCRYYCPLCGYDAFVFLTLSRKTPR